jgi:hypothetical protein
MPNPLVLQPSQSMRLPPELLHHISSCIDDLATFYSCSLTCRDWRELVKPRLFRTLTLFVEDARWNNLDAESTQALIRVGSYIHELRITTYAARGIQVVRNQASIESLLPFMPHLTSLLIYGVYFDSPNLFRNFLVSFPPTLTSLLVHKFGYNKGYFTYRNEIRDASKDPSALSALVTLQISDSELLSWLRSTGATCSVKRLKFRLSRAEWNLPGLFHFVDHSASTLTHLDIHIHDSNLPGTRQTFCFSTIMLIHV